MLKMSWDSLLKRKVRTFLTVLGVVIGTISIVVMMSLGIGMKKSMLEEMESYSNLKMIEVSEMGRWGYSGDNAKDDGDERHLDEEFIRTIENMEHVDMVVPILSVSAFAKAGVYECYMELQGISRDGLEKMDIPLAQGTLPESATELQLVYGNCVPASFYNSKTGNGYWETGEIPDIDFMNDSVFIVLDTDSYFQSIYGSDDGNPVKKPKKYITKASGIVEGAIDDYNQYGYQVYCDLDVLESYLKKEFKGKPIPGQPLKKSGKPYKEIFYNSVHVYVDNMDNVNDVQQQISDMGYEAYSEAEWIASDMQMVNIIQAVLGGIGAVSLFVAAIGITNTMMMSIYERTKEIGIMKVIGCKIRDIQVLFLLEAGFIGFIGGIIGVILSYGLSAIINKLVSGMEEMGLDNISVIPPWLCLVSVIFAVLIGMISGFLPSLRAMRLSPLSAIRAE